MGTPRRQAPAMPVGTPDDPLEMYDPTIDFVDLVGVPANGRRFLVLKHAADQKLEQAEAAVQAGIRRFRETTQREWSALVAKTLAPGGHRPDAPPQPAKGWPLSLKHERQRRQADERREQAVKSGAPEVPERIRRHPRSLKELRAARRAAGLE